MRRPAPPQYTFYMRDMASLIFAAGLSVAIRMSMRWSESEAARQEAIKSRTEAELKICVTSSILIFCSTH